MIYDNCAGGGVNGPQGATDALIIAADQVVLTDTGELMEKPASEESAKKRMRAFADTKVHTLGGLCVFDLQTNAEASVIDTATVQFDQAGLDEQSIDTLVQQGDVMHSAGALTVEDELVWPHVTFLQGSLDSVLGLGVVQLEEAVNAAIGTAHP